MVWIIQRYASILYGSFFDMLENYQYQNTITPFFFISLFTAFL